MSPGFGGSGYTSPQTRALTSIANTPVPDTSSQEKLVELLQQHSYQLRYLAANQKQLQQGVNDATANPIKQIQDFIADIIVLFGGGELAKGALDFGDLQYILPALGALFGFGDGPFPLSLFEAAEKFFLGYVVPQQQFVDVINQMITEWAGVFGIDPEFIKDTKALITAIGDLFDGVNNLFPSLNEMFNALGITSADLGPLGQALSPIMKLFGGLDLTKFGSLIEFITDAIDPFIVKLTAVINWVNSVLAVLGFDGDVVNSPLDDIPFANLIAGIRDGLHGIDLGGDPGAVLKVLGGLLGMDTSGGAPAVGDVVQTGLQLLFGQIPGSRIGSVGIGHLTAAQSNLMTAGTFPNAAAIVDNAIWAFDPTVSATADGSGSAHTTADGTSKVLRCNFIQCAEGDEITASVKVKWTGLAYSGTQPVTLSIRYFANKAVASTVQVAALTSPASSGGFTVVSGSTTAPAGVDEYYVRAAVEPTATAGGVWIDAGSTSKTGLIQMPWVKNLIQRWQQTADLFGLVDTDLDGDIDAADVWKAVITGKFNPLAASNPGLLDQTVVGGDSGLADLKGTLQALRDKIFPGGSGRSLADLANAGTDVANTAMVAADVGNSNAEILAIRNNQAAFEAMDPTAEATSPVTLLTGGSVPTFGITQSTAASAYIRIGKSALKGSIAWVGSGVTNISAAYLTVYKVDQTTGLWTKVYESADIAFLMGASMAWINHDIPAGDRIQVEPGEVYVIELKVRGTGTHTIAGTQMALPVNGSSSVWPSRHGQVRNGGTSASPSTIADASVTYSNNVPHFEFGISDGDIAVPVYTPRTVAFTTSGTYSIPDWAVYLDIICCGAGQGGAKGAGVSSGGGGNNGNWATDTLQRGVDIPLATTTLTITIDAGGAHGPFSLSGGGGGGDSSVSGIGMTTVTGAGGSGGSGTVAGAGGDDRTYNGVTYVQGSPTAGAPSSVPGENGHAPGGGGQGGRATGSGEGGAGARGQVWIVARTT